MSGYKIPQLIMALLI